VQCTMVQVGKTPFTPGCKLHFTPWFRFFFIIYYTGFKLKLAPWNQNFNSLLPTLDALIYTYWCSSSQWRLNHWLWCHRLSIKWSQISCGFTYINSAQELPPIKFPSHCFSPANLKKIGLLLTAAKFLEVTKLDDPVDKLKFLLTTIVQVVDSVCPLKSVSKKVTEHLDWQRATIV